jgi:2-pyrone-4,6-dicarboxylate lactonase
MKPSIDIVAVPETSVAAHALPAGACDAHSHVFGPFDRFPPLQPSVYGLPDASPAAHALVRKRLGMARGVLTQPAPYAGDPSAMLNAIATSEGALRGVAVATPAVDDRTLEAWRDNGIVGLRFVEMRAPGGARYPGSVGFAELADMAPRMRRLGLHAQLWGSADDFATWLPALEKLHISLVLDHMGCPDIAAGVGHASFQKILEFGASGDLWIKLTTCRVARSPDYSDARPFHDALLSRWPDRLVWGSDWPYVRMNPTPDAGKLLDLFHQWTPDDDLRRRILVDNSTQLYGFEGIAR